MQGLSEVLGGWAEGAQAALRGNPMPFMERFLWVKDERGVAVPFVARPNQVYFHGRTFGRLKGYHEPLTVYCLKDRKAAWTTYIKLAEAAFLFTVPGFAALSVADSDDTFRATNAMLDLAYARLPAEMQEQLPQKLWNSEEKVIAWPNGVTSSISMSSSRSKNFARGTTPKMGDFDEMAAYAEGFEGELFTAVENAFPSNRWWFEASTPRGTGNKFYSDFKAIQDGEWDAVYLFRRWFDNPENALGEGHLLARPQDRGDIVVGKAGGLVGERDEEGLVVLFPKGAVVADLLRRRRKWIADSVRTYRGDAALGYAAFRQEHAENEADCWTNLGNPQFDPLILSYLANQVRPPIEDSVVPGGLVKRIWERRMPGHFYTAGMDFATGRVEKGGDATTMQMFDATTMTVVAELYGKHTTVYNALGAAIQMCREYNNALFAPEVNTVGTTATDDARQKHEYLHLYYDRSEVRVGKAPEYGWKATPNTILKLWANLQGHLSEGVLKIPNAALLGEISGYDPNRDTHWPDRMRAFGIALTVALEWGAFGQPASAMTQRRIVIPVPY